MKKDIADKWVGALRSGKYKQGRGALHRGDKFCCLGVLCEVLEIPSSDMVVTGEFRYMGKDIGLPDLAIELSGIGSDVGEFGEAACLATFNDLGMTFEEIATIIKKNWKQL